MKIYCISLLACLSLACYENVDTGTIPTEDSHTTAKGDAFKHVIGGAVDMSSNTKDVTGSDVSQQDIIKIDIKSEEMLPPAPDYPGGPYSMELFKVVPDMTFYDPWRNKWFSISEYFQHEKHKAFILVSSAGWCGPCLTEAAALIGIYNKYHDDGLEIVYTLGNTNIPGDAPFDTTADDINSAGFAADLKFMENWQLMAQDQADQFLTYNMYADPNREFIKYLPQHAWPLSLLITTKDMGVRLVEEGFWSPLMKNKIMLVLYNEVPDIPFE
tara:strand:- start:18 stop:830 length:813 start_codon:yes stop_codon:yes gene_type:complete